jgi:hypothetical protein
MEQDQLVPATDEASRLADEIHSLLAEALPGVAISALAQNVARFIVESKQTDDSIDWLALVSGAIGATIDAHLKAN